MSYKRLSTRVLDEQYKLGSGVSSASQSTISLQSFSRGSSEHPFSTMFKFSVFLPVFLYHVFFPFSLPVWWLFEGSVALRNYMLYPFTRDILLCTYAPAIALWVVVICNVYSLIQLSLPFDLINLVLTSGLLWILRCAAIAVKWGYAPPQLLSHLATTAPCPQVRLENMFSWLTLTPFHIIQELYLAGLQNGVDIESLYFRVDSVSAAAMIMCKNNQIAAQSTSSSSSCYMDVPPIVSFVSASPFQLDPPVPLTSDEISSSLPLGCIKHSSPYLLASPSSEPLFYPPPPLPPSISSLNSSPFYSSVPHSSAAPSSSKPEFTNECGDALKNVLFGKDAQCLRVELERMETLFHAHRASRIQKQLLMTETGCVPFILVLLAMTMKASEPATQTNPRNKLIMFVLAFVLSSIPLVQRICDGSLLSLLEGRSDAPAWVTLVPMLAGGYFYWFHIYAISRLLFGGVIDYERRLALSKICTELISPRVVEQHRVSKYEYPTVTVVNSPLQLQHPENIVSWLACRTILDVFGERYKSRAQINCSACLVYLILFGTLTFFTDLLNTEKVSMGVLFCSNAVLTSVCPVLMAGYGMLANDQCNESRLQLKRQQIMLQRTDRSRSHGAHGSGLCVDLLSHASEVLSIEDSIRPLRIFGVKAGPTFFRLIVTLLTSLASLFVRKFLA